MAEKTFFTDLKKGIKERKNKQVNVRVKESDINWIEDNKLSKTSLFDFGLSKAKKLKNSEGKKK